jgi:hypothetical protein
LTLNDYDNGGECDDDDDDDNYCYDNKNILAIKIFLHRKE